MSLVANIKRRLANVIHTKRQVKPSIAYNLWAFTYDEQTNNPLIFLDEKIFNLLIDRIDIDNKIIVDVGCGTGRHWKKILTKNPLELIGYDVSNEMLKRLQTKYPFAKIYLPQNNLLKELKDKSCDVVISNLVIGYIKDLSGAFAEWNRVLKNNGQVIITDFHPIALHKGANRSFTHKERLFFIRNYIHTIDKVRQLAKKNKWAVLDFIERTVDEDIKHFYEQSHAVSVYEKDYGVPLLYGIHLTK